MNEKQAAKFAAKSSKEDGAAQFVVWVFDDGRHVYSAEQARRYAPFLHIEAAYVAGVKVADAQVVLEVA